MLNEGTKQGIDTDVKKRTIYAHNTSVREKTDDAKVKAFVPLTNVSGL